MLSIDDESFIADSVCLGAPHVRRGWIQSRQTRIGRRTFVGNSAMVPQGTRLGSNCLVGVLSVSPESALERMKDGTSWLGSPPMELPRRQAGSCFAETSTYSPTKLLVLQRLFIEFFRITLPGTFLVLATYSALGSLFWLQLQVSTPAAWALMPLVSLFCLALFVGLAVALKWLLIGRFKPGNHPLWSLFIWKNELVTAMHEAFAVPALVHILQGTPLMAWYLRALGCKVGRDTIIETTRFTEFDLVELGNRVSLNSHCTVQTHLFEDRVSKQSSLKIGDDSGLGAMAVVLVDSRMGDGSYLNALSLPMKGEALPPRSEWAGIPIRKVNAASNGRMKESHP
jgi:non-ribosomal peptide synthetase-like protein